MPVSVGRWLLLIHQIPPRPSYLRVKIGRRLQALGAVAVKNSVYVLPRSDEALEDFQWVRREIVSGKGDATVCEARFVEGLSDDAVEALFERARSAEYEALLREGRALRAALARRGPRAPTTEQAVGAVTRLRKRFADVQRIDFFQASGREDVETTLSAIEARLRPPERRAGGSDAPPMDVRGRTWATRSGVHVDRIASAWLIRRFIDPDARFRFVRGADEALPGELRFDMFEGDFSHEGESCTFEVLLKRFGLDDPALARIGEIVHDVDLKDGRFGHPETAGLDHLVAGIAMRHKDDDSRLAAGAVAFEALHEYFKRKR